MAQPGVCSTSSVISGMFFFLNMTGPQSNDCLSSIESYPSTVTQWIRASLFLEPEYTPCFAPNGPSAATNFVRYSYHLYSGFGIPHLWYPLPWRENLQIPRRNIDQIFPEIDFRRSGEVLYPFPRDLGVLPQELIVLNKVVDHLQAKRVVEFGTAEGRTALNIAAHLPPISAEIITLDLPDVPGKNVAGGFFKTNHRKQRSGRSLQVWILGIFVLFGLQQTLYFATRADLLPGLAAEAYQAFSLIKPGGVIFRHDYSSAEGPTKFSLTGWRHNSPSLISKVPACSAFR